MPKQINARRDVILESGVQQVCFLRSISPIDETGSGAEYYEVPSNTDYQVRFYKADAADASGMLDTTELGARIRVAAPYHIETDGMHVRWDAPGAPAAAGEGECWFTKNGTELVRVTCPIAPAPGTLVGSVMGTPLSWLEECAVDDVIKMYIRHNNASSIYVRGLILTVALVP